MVALPSIPKPSTSFVGREEEIRALDRLVRENASRLVTILGPPGIGKTRLALRYLETAQTDEFSGSLWFVDLTSARTLEDLCAAIATELGTFTNHGENLVESIAQALSARGRTLIVLDNFEQLVKVAAVAVKRWTELARSASFILTSRELLGIARETIFELGPLPVPSLTDLSPKSVSNATATALLLARVPNLVVTEQNARLVAEILVGLEGIPLAIELCAARFGTLGEADVLSRMSQRLDLLNRGPRDRDARQRTLRGAIDWSWELLHRDEQLALRACSVFVGGFDARAFEAVCGESLAGLGLDVLQSLREKSLVCIVPSDGASGRMRLGLYESIRAYAEEKLAESGERANFSARHAEYYAERGLSASERARDGDDSAEAFLASEFDNLLAAFERLDGAPETSLLRTKLMIALAPELAKRGPCETYQRMLDQTLALAEGATLPAAYKACVFRARARLSRQRGRLQCSAEDLELARSAARLAKDKALESAVLCDQGELELERGQFDKVREHYSAALALTSHRERKAQARARAGLGLLCHSQGQLDEALALYEQALRDASEVSDRHLQATVTKDIGSVRLQQGRLDEARECYARAAELLDELNDPVLSGVVEANLGILAQECAATTEALTYFLSAERKLSRSGARLWHAHVVGYLGAFYQETGELERAASNYGEALHVLREIGDLRLEGLFLTLLGTVHAARGRVPAAREALEGALRLLSEVGDPGLLDALTLGRGFLMLAESTEAERNDELATSSQIRRDVELILADFKARRERGELSHSDDARLMLRLLERALTAEAWVFNLDSAELRPSQGEPILLATRPQLLRIVRLLVERRIASPAQAVTQEELLEAAWPGERMQPAAASNRMKVALSTLRKLGLRDLLQRTQGGYLIDPKVPVVCEQRKVARHQSKSEPSAVYARGE